MFCSTTLCHSSLLSLLFYCSPSLSATVRYVTLKGLTNKTNHLKKSTEMNVQIHAMALLDTGNEVSCLARGTGPQQESDHIYKGTVFSHNNSPDYDETMNIHLPADKDRLSRMHILFMLYVYTYIHIYTHRAARSLLFIGIGIGLRLRRTGDTHIYISTPP